MNEQLDTPNLNAERIQTPIRPNFSASASVHPPRILLLYGSLRKRSFSRLVIEESARLLTLMGAEVRIFNPEGLPQPDTEDEKLPKVQELRDLMTW